MKTILVIDDEEELRSCITSLLENEYRVLSASAGRDGLAVLQKEEVSLVVLDYSLPDMDGLEILARIREGYDIPVIMITAYGNKEVVLKSWRYRADFFFDKPFVLKELREKVRELLAEGSPFDTLGLDPSRLSPHVRKAVEFMASRATAHGVRDTKLTLKEIAGALNISPKYLSLLFKKECGLGIYRCMNILSVERAKMLLKDEEKDIKEIAFELGYRHPNNFSRLFKRVTGVLPSAFRKGF